MKQLDLHTLSERTRISKADLEEAVQQQLYPDRDWYISERTISGQFDEIACVLIAAAASLLHAGLRPDAVNQVMKALSRIQKPGRNSLRLPIIADAVTDSEHAVVQVSERRFVRWKLGTRDSEWTEFDGNRAVAVEGYEPMVVVAIDIACIRDIIRK